MLNQGKSSLLHCMSGGGEKSGTWLAKRSPSAQPGWTMKLGDSQMTANILDTGIWDKKIFAGGWVDGHGGSQEVREPATGDLLTTVGLGNASDIVIAAATAAVAQKQWLAMPPRDKAAIFLKAARLMEEQADALGLWIARETGGLVLKGMHEVREAATIFQLAAGLITGPQ